MRHLTRLYYENTTSTEQFVSLIDQGEDSGNHLFNIKVGTLPLNPTLDELIAAIQFLWASQCFFKLPIGAHAVVDVYVPDVVGTGAKKVFDYQVFKAKASADSAKQEVALAELLERLKQIPAELFETCCSPNGGEQSGPAGPAAPNALTMATGPSGGICTYYPGSGPSGPCGGQTDIPCPDAITMRASCSTGGGMAQLICVRRNPVVPGEP